MLEQNLNNLVSGKASPDTQEPLFAVAYFNDNGRRCTFTCKGEREALSKVIDVVLDSDKSLSSVTKL